MLRCNSNIIQTKSSGSCRVWWCHSSTDWE